MHGIHLQPINKRLPNFISHVWTENLWNFWGANGFSVDLDRSDFCPWSLSWSTDSRRVAPEQQKQTLPIYPDGLEERKTPCWNRKLATLSIISNLCTLTGCKCSGLKWKAIKQKLIFFWLKGTLVWLNWARKLNQRKFEMWACAILSLSFSSPL